MEQVFNKCSMLIVICFVEIRTSPNWGEAPDPQTYPPTLSLSYTTPSPPTALRCPLPGWAPRGRERSPLHFYPHQTQAFAYLPAPRTIPCSLPSSWTCPHLQGSACFFPPPLGLSSQQHPHLHHSVLPSLINRITPSLFLFLYLLCAVLCLVTQ